jgi:hypothetical protein
MFVAGPAGQETFQVRRGDESHATRLNPLDLAWADELIQFRSSDARQPACFPHSHR